MPQFHAQSPEPSIAPDAARTRRFGLRVCVALAVCAICAVADAQYFEGLGLFGQTPPAAPAVFRDLADWAPSSAPLDFAVQERFDAAIVRGANLSELPIAPLSGRVFGVADATFGRQDSQGYDAFRSGFKVDSYGANVGYDGRLGTRAVWGFGAQGRRVNISPAADIYDTRINSFGGNIHMAIFGPLWRVDLAFGTAKNWHTQRLSEFCANKFSTSQWNYEAEFGVRYDKGYTRIEPFLNFRAITLQEPAAADSPTTLVGRPSDFSDASYRLRLGSRFSWEYETRLATMTPYLIASYAREFGSQEIYIAGENAAVPIAYRFANHKMGRDRLDLGGGVDLALRDTFDVFFKYDFEIANKYVDYLFLLGFNKKF